MKVKHFSELNTWLDTGLLYTMARSLRLPRAACLSVTCVMGATLALSSSANAQATDKAIPDAQVEASVLKALAGAPELVGEDIHIHTVYGVVTLSGTIRNEVLQTRAENLAADANGVKKVVDELQVGAGALAAGQAASQAASSAQTANNAQAASASPAPATGADLPAPGSAPASSAVMNNPEQDQQQYQQQDQRADRGQPAQTATTSPTQPSQSAPTQSSHQTNTYPSPRGGYDRQPMQADSRYPVAPEYGQSPRNQQNQQASNRTPQYGYGQSADRHQPSNGGQQPGRTVLVPDGTMIRVRLNQSISSNRSTPGSTFDATVESDVVADGAVAIPRGAQVSGTVVAATRSGVLKGRGDLTVALNAVTLGGRVYPLVTRPWFHHGGDKTIETVDKTAGFGAAGAVIGALAGGGAGAAVGGGIGAAAGLGSSATSGRGQVYLPAEGVVTFRLAQAASVATVSEQEMQRLAYGAVPAQGPRYPRPRRYPPVYIAPVYYPGYYPGYYPRYYPGYYPGPYGYPPY